MHYLQGKKMLLHVLFVGSFDDTVFSRNMCYKKCWRRPSTTICDLMSKCYLFYLQAGGKNMLIFMCVICVVTRTSLALFQLPDWSTDSSTGRQSRSIRASDADSSPYSTSSCIGSHHYKSPTMKVKLKQNRGQQSYDISHNAEVKKYCLLRLMINDTFLIFVCACCACVGEYGPDQ